MTDSTFRPDALTDRRDQAAWWHARLQSEDVCTEERAAFEAWHSDPENAEIYQQMQQLWAIASALPDHEVRKLACGIPSLHSCPPAPTQPLSTTRSHRRTIAFGLAFTCSLFLACVMIDPFGWRTPPLYEASFRTQAGQQHVVTLPDGSRLTLNTATHAIARFYKDRRVVDLTRGEVLFQVDGTNGTPFIVDTPGGSVKVTGTIFNVRSHSGIFAVGVLEGSVEVTTGHWWNRHTTRLVPDHQLQIPSSGGMNVQPSGAANLTAWTEGKIIFRGITLADAINEISQYAGTPIAIADAKAARLKVSGVFRTSDPAAFLTALPKIAPVQVRMNGTGPAQINAR